MHRTDDPPSFQLSMILGVFGLYDRIEGALSDTLKQLEHYLPRLDAELVVTYESERWRSTPLSQVLALRFDKGHLRTSFSQRPATLAAIFNEGASQARGTYLLFLWPGCLLNSDAIESALTRLDSSNEDWVATIDDELIDKIGLVPEIIVERFIGYFLSCCSLFSLSQALVRRSSFLALGGFNPSPILQREFEAEFFHRSVLQQNKVALTRGQMVRNVWSLEDLPLVEDHRVPGYVAHSYRIRSVKREIHELQSNELETNYLKDLPLPERQFVTKLFAEPINDLMVTDSPGPYKVAVTGGIWEYAHNRLCFYNHFECLEGKGLFTYIPLLDMTLKPHHDLRSVDAVIISRGRHPNVLRVIEYCKNHAIPTIYMIDDNWFSVGKDWPEQYESIFSPGQPSYEIFVTCLKECDAVIIYNTTLEEDVAPYAKRILKLPTNVRRGDFSAPLENTRLASEVRQLVEWRNHTGGSIVGFVGSPRFTDAAFRALVKVTKTHSQKVKLLFFGALSPEHQKIFKDAAVILPYIPYEEYAATLGNLAPDILIAPLDDCRSSRSKCPNKYLEYSIVGAAGIFSDIPPYSDAVTNGVNGLLVKENQELAWEVALSSLLDDQALVKRIAKAAQLDVISRYESSIIAPMFADAILGLIHEINQTESGGET